MVLKKMVIHKIDKKTDSREAEVIIFDVLADLNKNAYRLIHELSKVYSKDKIQYGFFDSEKKGDFYKEYDDYIKSDKEEEKFLNLTNQLTNQLSRQMETEYKSRGGYLVHCESEEEGRDYYSIYLIRDVSGLIFDNKGSNFSIGDTTYVDTKKLAMACRVDEILYREKPEIRYLSLTDRSKVTVSNYFARWVGIENSESNKEYTESLLKIVDNIELPINPNDGTKYKPEDFRQTVFEFINTISGKVVNLKDMGTHFYKNEMKFIDHAKESGAPIDTEFRPFDSTLKRMSKITLNRDDIRLTFSRRKFDEDKIRISGDTVIIESKSLVTQLKKQVGQSDE